MRRAVWLLLLGAGCGDPQLRPPEPDEPPAKTPAATAEPELEPVLERASEALGHGDVAGAREGLERSRWLAEDRARAALVLHGCLMLEGRTADAIAVLRDYLEKTTKVTNPRDRIAIRILRHHATGGGLTATGAEESCYFGLYALKALEEPETARPDLERARSEAPDPERQLAALALK